MMHQSEAYGRSGHYKVGTTRGGAREWMIYGTTWYTRGGATRYEWNTTPPGKWMLLISDSLDREKPFVLAESSQSACATSTAMENKNLKLENLKPPWKTYPGMLWRFRSWFLIPDLHLNCHPVETFGPQTTWKLVSSCAQWALQVCNLHVGIVRPLARIVTSTIMEKLSRNSLTV